MKTRCAGPRLGRDAEVVRTVDPEVQHDIGVGRLSSLRAFNAHVGVARFNVITLEHAAAIAGGELAGYSERVKAPPCASTREGSAHRHYCLIPPGPGRRSRSTRRSCGGK